MNTVYPLSNDEPGHVHREPRVQLESAAAGPSAVSWGAIFAGAAAAAALSLILLLLGSGLGLSAASPWAREGMGATTLGVSAIVWVTVTQVLASGMGGYLAGRLRTRWVEVAADEVYFRDTAHGMLAWAIASLASAALLTSVIGSIAGTGVRAGAAAAGAVVAGSAASGRTAAADGPMGYLTDALFRRAANAPAVTVADASPPASPEVMRIFVNAAAAGALPPDDMRYLAQSVSQRTGLAQADAEKRVTDTFTRMQTRLEEAKVAASAAADKARKATARTALWLFISLLIGAFVASLAATFGGRQRDH
jgi:hypothetical protein